MKRILALAALFILPALAPAADLPHWFLRGAEAANCIAQGLDAGTTVYGIDNIPGTVEKTKFYVSNGHLNRGLFFSVKGAICAAPIVTHWLIHRSKPGSNGELFLVGPAAASAVVTGIVAGQNWRYIRAWRPTAN
jgi:hypothetical protein